jgi:hypothetical protein
MPLRRKTILTLKPGTRKMSYAVTIDGVLVDYGTKYFKGVWSEEKLRKILVAIEKLRERYRPAKIELKVAHPSRRSEGVNKVLNKLKTKMVYFLHREN